MQAQHVMLSLLHNGGQLRHLGPDLVGVGAIGGWLPQRFPGRRRCRCRPRLLRPDPCHELLDDVGKGSFPGNSAIGRLKGLAEIRGVMTALASV